MANTSIFNAFERMWQHIVAALGNKSDINHTHNDLNDAINMISSGIVDDSLYGTTLPSSAPKGQIFFKKVVE